MARIVLLQFAAALIMALLALLFFGFSSGVSALLGGLCCAVPNAFFALRLTMSARKPGGANPMSFFIGEFIKIGLTIMMLWMVVSMYKDVKWMAFLATFVIVLKSYFILLFRYRP